MGNYGHEDFLGFEFKGKHSSDFNLLRVSNGKRYDDNLVPTIQDKTQQVPGGNGAYWFNSYHTQKDFPTMNVAFDNLSEEGLRELREWLNGLDQGDLVFDESPYKKYLAKVKSAPQFKYVCFDEEDWSENLFQNSSFTDATQISSWQGPNSYPNDWGIKTTELNIAGSKFLWVSNGVYSVEYRGQNYIHMSQQVNRSDAIKIDIEQISIRQFTNENTPINYEILIKSNDQQIFLDTVSIIGNSTFNKKYSLILKNVEANSSISIIVQYKNGTGTIENYTTFSIKNPQIFERHLNRVYKGEGTIQFTAYKPYATSVHKYLNDYTDPTKYSNKSQWQGASKMLTSAAAALPTLDAYSSTALLATGTIYTYNPGDKPTDFKLYVTPPNTDNETITISNGINSLTLTSIALQSGDVRLVFDTGAQLIRSVNSSGNLTNHLYNRYITSGDFFKIPVSTTSTDYTPITITVSSVSSTSVAVPSIDYRYIYY